jgi:ubiquinone/menaquinone biosynthesis C-methylase UbiE
MVQHGAHALGVSLDNFGHSVIADPITKMPKRFTEGPMENGVVDLRVYLKNSPGYDLGIDGQDEFEKIVSAGGAIEENSFAGYKDEIEYDRVIYEHFRLSGNVLDVGGGVGTIREFLDSAVNYMSVDPHIGCFREIPQAKIDAYSCLKEGCNFISGMAEFLPITSTSFDWVHMRSMLDHVQVPDLALIEARRVLKENGRLLVGMLVEGGKSGQRTLGEKAREFVKALLARFLKRFRDHHVWHPTYFGLVKLLNDNGFEVVREFWQPKWRNKVVYIEARIRS